MVLQICPQTTTITFRVSLEATRLSETFEFDSRKAVTQIRCEGYTQNHRDCLYNCILLYLFFSRIKNNQRDLIEPRSSLILRIRMCLTITSHKVHTLVLTPSSLHRNEKKQCKDSLCYSDVSYRHQKTRIYRFFSFLLEVTFLLRI